MPQTFWCPPHPPEVEVTPENIPYMQVYRQHQPDMWTEELLDMTMFDLMDEYCETEPFKVLQAMVAWYSGAAAHWAGVAIPAAAVEHQYMVTEKLPELPADLPTLRDPDKNFYLKPEVGGFAIGGWEDDAPAFCPDGIPPGFARELLESNFERFEQIALPAAERIPALNEVGVRNLINGPIPVSADGEPVMGRAPGLDNFFIACGDRHWQYHSVHPDTGVHEFSCGPASDQHAGGTPGENISYHRYHRVKGGFLSVSVRRAARGSEIAFRFHDVDGKVVYEHKRAARASAPRTQKASPVR